MVFAPWRHDDASLGAGPGKVGERRCCREVFRRVFLSWRSLATDTRKLGFDIYRDGVKITAAPVVTTTNYVDKDGRSIPVMSLKEYWMVQRPRQRKK